MTQSVAKHDTTYTAVPIVDSGVCLKSQVSWTYFSSLNAVLMVGLRTFIVIHTLSYSESTTCIVIHI